MATQNTDFAGLANSGMVGPRAYAGVAQVAAATQQGDYQENRELQSPWPPPDRPGRRPKFPFD